MSKIFLYIIIITFACLLLISCNVLDSNSDITPIEGKIYFKLWENYDYNMEEQYPKIELVLETEKIYPHTGHSINANLTVHGNTINIGIEGVYNCGAGGATPSPASWREFLDISDGKHALNFIIYSTKNKKHNSYQIVLDKNTITIEDDEQSFTIPKYKKYCRYPQNSFAYLFGSLTDDSYICKDFIDSLKNIIPIEQFTFPDNCIIPYSSASSGHYYDAPAQFYKYKDEKYFDIAGEFLKTYSADIISKHQGMSISLIGWNNKTVKSWLYD